MNNGQFKKLIESINSLGGIDWPTIFISIFGTVISAMVAFKIAKYQADKSDQQFQKQISENRKLEKELFFYKSRHDAIGECMNAIDNIIDSFKEVFSTLRNLEMTKIQTGNEAMYEYATALTEKTYEPLMHIQEFEKKYSKIIWGSYFNDERIVNLEREIRYLSSELNFLFRDFLNGNRDFLKRDYKILSYALEKYIINKLILLYNLFNMLNSINSLYFVNDEYEDATINTIFEANERNVNCIKKEIREWKFLLDSEDIDNIIEKKENMEEMVKNH